MTSGRWPHRNETHSRQKWTITGVMNSAIGGHDAVPSTVAARAVEESPRLVLKSGVKSGPFIRICLKTAHLHAKFMQQSIKASQSWLQPASDFNL